MRTESQVNKPNDRTNFKQYVRESTGTFRYRKKKREKEKKSDIHTPFTLCTTGVHFILFFPDSFRVFALACVYKLASEIERSLFFFLLAFGLLLINGEHVRYLLIYTNSITTL